MCKYCEEEEPIANNNNKKVKIKWGELFISLCTGYSWVSDKIEINYCPICGRKLGE